VPGATLRPVREVKFDPQGGPLAVEIVVKGGQPGAYRVFLWNAKRTQQRGVAAGLTTDATPSRLAVPVAAARAAGRLLEWNVVVEGQVGDPYDLSVVLLQGDKPLRGGRLRYQGALEASQLALVGLVTFVAAAVK